MQEDAVQKALALVKQLEEGGMSPAEAKKQGMAEMMKLMTAGGDQSAGEEEDTQGDMQEDVAEGETNKDGDIQTMMAIIKAKKAAGGKVMPKMEAPSLT